MKNLSNELLVQTYYKATQISLNPHFIFLIQAELKYRGIEVEETDSSCVNNA